MKHLWRRLGPANTPAQHREHTIGAVGALLGIGVIALIDVLATGSLAASVPLIAPMGASAVIIFCLPKSPLAQPWNVVLGNVASALAGVACARMIPDPAIAASVAIACAIAVMALLRCIHPPGGAVALTAVLGGPHIGSLGFLYAVDPVLISSAALTVVAMGYHRVTRNLRAPA